MFYKLYLLLWEYDHPRESPGMIAAGRANKRTIVAVFGTFYIASIGMLIFAIIRKQFF